jgi:hypothetical protein
MRIEHQVQIASYSTCFVILRRYKQSWQSLEHDKKLGNAFNNNLDHGDYENHGTWVGLFIYCPCCTFGTKSKQDF